MKDLNFSQNLKYKQNDIDSLLSNLIEERLRQRDRETFKFKLIKFFKFFYTRLSILSTSEPKPKLAPEFKQILQLTKELTNKNDAKLYFVYLPEYSRYTKTYDNTNYNLIKNTVIELKIPFIDIHEEIFLEEQNPLKLFPFELFGRYNIDGYKKVAETIYEFTKD